MSNRGPRPRELLFGGKSPQALPWIPLPHMEEWLENLYADEVTADYIRAAKVGLKHFAIFADANGIKHPDEITRTHLLRFQAHLTKLTKEDGDLLSLAYRQQLMKYVRNWINWLHEIEHIENNPWVRIKVGQVAKKPKPLEEDEVALLFDTHRKQAFTMSPFYFHRREAMLVLLYAWGLRLHELQSLTVQAVDMRAEWVTVRNKSRAGSSNSTKVLPYGSELKQVVMRFLVHRARFAVPGEDTLFVDQNGSPLSTHLIRKIITDLGHHAGLNINPHRLRDTFGTTMLDNDVEVERIMKMMGHTNRAQTLAYARVNDPKLKESHDRVMGPLINSLLGGSLP